MTTRRKRTYAEVAAAEAEAEDRFCAAAGCRGHGVYPAPRSRTQFRPYVWLCLEHVRAYNAAWDFYAGMSADQIESEIRKDTVWRRPSWRLGERKSILIDDAFGLFDEMPREAQDNARRQGLPPEAAEALALFSLAWPVTLVEIKARYKQLVKEHHPDRHGGDRDAEERLKTINLAYGALVRYFDGDLRAKKRGPMSSQDQP